MYRRILVPLDGSRLAELALPRAQEMVRLTGAPLHLLRVIDFTRLERYGPHALAMEYAAVEPALSEEHALAHAYLQEIELRLSEGDVTVTSEVRQGRIAREITATLQPDDLIVMSSHGRGGLSRWLLGSVAEDVLRHATVPVLLIKAAADSAVPPVETEFASAIA